MPVLQKLKFHFRKYREKIRFWREEKYIIDLSCYFQHFVKNGQKPLPYFYEIARSRKNELRRWLDKNDPITKEGVWLESGFSFVLVKTENPKNTFFINKKGIACVTFEVDGEDILIKQIQGLKGAQEHLKTIRWEQMLVKIAADWAKNVGFKKIKIQEALKNSYYKEREPEWNKRFIMRYNVTAKRLGFRFDAQEGAYVLKLTQ